MKSKFTALALSLAIAGCATSPDKIAASYVSPLQYSHYDCQQVTAELSRVGAKVSELNGTLKKKASDDSAKTTVGIILFFPVLFFLDGNSPQATEYAQLKGEYQALEKAGIEKKCGIPPAPLIQVKSEPEPAKPATSVVGGQ